MKSVELSSNAISEVSAGIQQIAASVKEVSSTSLDASNHSKEGNTSIKNAVTQMNSINQTVERLSTDIQGLGERSKEINQIIQVITGIARQTNLLALNAAIEAARAGEHGRGFAVVADEVRKLAEQSSQSSQQVSAMVAGIQAETAKAVQSMEVAVREVIDGISVIGAAGKSFTQIQNSVDTVTSQIQEVSSAVEQIASGANQMVQSMDVINKVSESSAYGAQEVSAATEQQHASMQEIASSAGSLAKMAEELQSLIGTFKV